MAQCYSQPFHCMKVRYYERDREYPRMKNHAVCAVRPAAQRQQAGARRQHGFSCVRTRGRVHNTFTQHASEIAGNSIAAIVEMQKKLK